MGRVSSISRRALLLAAVSVIPAAGQEESTLPLAVYVNGSLPGFHPNDAARYVAERMSQPYVGRWRFPTGKGRPADSPNRVEWRFEEEAMPKTVDPDFAPEPGEGNPPGSHLIGAQLKLFLGGKYMTAIFHQAAVKGGPADEKLGAFLSGMTETLLGPTGAYHAIDRRWKPLP